MTTRAGQVVNAIGYHPYGSTVQEHQEPGYSGFSADYRLTDKEQD